MKSLIHNFIVLLITAVFLTSCYNDGGVSGQNANIDTETTEEAVNEDFTNDVVPDEEVTDDVITYGGKATPQHVKMIIEEAIKSFFDEIDLGDLKPSLNDRSINIGEGLTVDVEFSLKPFKLLLTYTFDECEVGDFTVNGIMTALVTEGITDRAIMLVINTEEPLKVSGPEINETTIEIVDLAVIYEFVQTKLNFSGKIIINGTEYNFDDFVHPDMTIGLIADTMSRVDWEVVKDKLNTLNPFSRLIFTPLTIYNADGLKIDLQVDLMNLGVVLTFTYDGFKIIDDLITKEIYGVMTAFVTFEDIFNLKLKLIINTEEGAPLVIPGWLFDQTIGFEDVTLYFSLIELNFVEDPEPSGTVIFNGIPIDINAEWVKFLISILSFL